jgi:hypothetical protein
MPSRSSPPFATAACPRPMSTRPRAGCSRRGCGWVCSIPPGSNAYARIPASENDTPAHRALALETAKASLVLLKNDGLLPLKAAPRTIAVIGPNADSIDALVGNYNGTPSKPVTVLAGLKARFPQARIIFVEGSGPVGSPMARTPDAVFCVDAACADQGREGRDLSRSVAARPGGGRRRQDRAVQLGPSRAQGPRNLDPLVGLHHVRRDGRPPLPPGDRRRLPPVCRRQADPRRLGRGRPDRRPGRRGRAARRPASRHRGGSHPEGRSRRAAPQLEPAQPRRRGGPGGGPRRRPGGLRRRPDRAAGRRGDAGPRRRLRGRRPHQPGPAQAAGEPAGEAARHGQAGRAGADERQRHERQLGRQVRCRPSSRPGIRAARAARRSPR